MTLSTYYPAPSGVYTRMITTGDTFLARDGGDVGIGTAGPLLAKLHIAGNILLSAANPQITFNAGGPTLSSPGGSSLTIGTAGVERMRVDSAGNVGIGTNNPLMKLDVNGTMIARGCMVNTIVSYPVTGPTVYCPANNYVTWATGLMTKYQRGTVPALSGGSMYCCPCGGTCPSL